VIISSIFRSGKVFGAPRARPALLIRMSMGPVWSTTFLMAVLREEKSRTSTTAVKTLTDEPNRK
jgi:hypothetical protein